MLSLAPDDAELWWTRLQHLLTETPVIHVQVADLGTVTGELVAIQDGPGGPMVVVHRPPGAEGPADPDTGSIIWIPIEQILTLTVPYHRENASRA